MVERRYATSALRLYLWRLRRGRVTRVANARQHSRPLRYYPAGGCWSHYVCDEAGGGYSRSPHQLFISLHCPWAGTRAEIEVWGPDTHTLLTRTTGAPNSRVFN